MWKPNDNKNTITIDWQPQSSDLSKPFKATFSINGKYLWSTTAFVPTRNVRLYVSVEEDTKGKLEVLSATYTKSSVATPDLAMPDAVNTGRNGRNLDGKTLTIQNKWGCPDESRCDQWFNFSGTNPPYAYLYDKTDTVNRVPWLFTAVGADTYHIQSKWRCPGDTRCDMYLSYDESTQRATLNKTPVAWKVSTGPNQTYYLAAPNGKSLGFEKVAGFNQIMFTDPVPWSLQPRS